MQTYKIPQHGQFGKACSIITTDSGSYVVPGWHSVEYGTTLDQIEWLELEKPAPKEAKIYRAESSSKPGKWHEVKFVDGRWSCSCASGTWRRGDCRHIKSIKAKN